MMGDIAAFTVTKENVEDDQALLKTGVIGTGTEVLVTKINKLLFSQIECERWKSNPSWTTTSLLIQWIAIPSRNGTQMTGRGLLKTSSSKVKGREASEYQLMEV